MSSQYLAPVHTADEMFRTWRTPSCLRFRQELLALLVIGKLFEIDIPNASGAPLSAAVSWQRLLRRITNLRHVWTSFTGLCIFRLFLWGDRLRSRVFFSCSHCWGNSRRKHRVVREDARAQMHGGQRDLGKEQRSGFDHAKQRHVGEVVSNVREP